MTIPVETSQTVSTPAVPTPAQVAPYVAPQVPAGPTQADFLAAIEKARNEVRSEFTGQLSARDEQLAALLADKEARDKAAQEETDRLAAIQKAADEEKMTLTQRLEAFRTETSQQIAGLNSELQKRDALLQKEREYNELREYRDAKIAEFVEPNPATGHPGIHPQFVDLISGSTREQIDHSVATMVNKTRAIVDEVAQFNSQTRAATPGVSPTGGNLGPLDQVNQTRTYSAEDIANVAPGSPEHLAMRAAAGIGQRTQHGQFG